MEKTIFRVLLTGIMTGVFGKHVFVSKAMTWPQAQAYCRLHYTDLSFISSASEDQKLKEAAGRKFASSFWIGLYRDSSNSTYWRWSGGGYASYQAWACNQPDNNNNGNYGAVNPDGWHDNHVHHQLPFFCFRLVVVQEEKTWAEALEHCREHHTDLASLTSEMEQLWAQEEIQQVAQGGMPWEERYKMLAQTEVLTGHLWTGLRYLANRWLWVNGDLLEYKAWRGAQGSGEHPLCPAWHLRCGAMLREGGAWEAWDCQERLNFICY